MIPLLGKSGAVRKEAGSNEPASFLPGSVSETFYLIGLYCLSIIDQPPRISDQENRLPLITSLTRY